MAWTDVVWFIVGVVNVGMLLIVLAALLRRWRRLRLARLAPVQFESLPPIDQCPLDDPATLSKLAAHCRLASRRNEETRDMTIASMRATHAHG